MVPNKCQFVNCRYTCLGCGRPHPTTMYFRFRICKCIRDRRFLGNSFLSIIDLPKTVTSYPVEVTEKILHLSVVQPRASETYYKSFIWFVKETRLLSTPKRVIECVIGKAPTNNGGDSQSYDKSDVWRSYPPQDSPNKRQHSFNKVYWESGNAGYCPACCLKNQRWRQLSVETLFHKDGTQRDGRVLLAGF